MAMDNQVIKQPTAKPKKLNPKQKRVIELWIDPTSNTFGNLYRSALDAGFSPTYALNLANAKPLWLSENMDKQILDKELITQGVQAIATGKNIDSRSVDDTRLKAYELLGRYAGLDNQGKGNVTVVNVQPILGGDSVKYAHAHDHIIDQAPEEKAQNKNKTTEG